MGGSHMCWDGRVIILCQIPWVNSDATILVKDFHLTGGIQQFYFLADILVWYTIIVLIHPKTYMPILHYRHMGLVLYLIPVLSQWCQLFSFYFIKQIGS